jgi:uncharacterized protein YcfJ
MNLSKKNVLSLVLVGFIVTNFSGCASKSDVNRNSSRDECGEGTTGEGSIIGTIFGGLVGAITGGNKKAILLATATGAGIGAIAGHLLSEMQCKYHGQEQELIKQINLSKENQEKLLKDSSDLSKKITELSNEMRELDNRKYMSKSKKEKLLSSINQKSKSIIALQQKNSSSKSKIREYSSSIDTYKYKDSDKDALKKSLNELNSEQAKIETACVDNLEKLKELKRRIIL